MFSGRAPALAGAVIVHVFAERNTQKNGTQGDRHTHHVLAARYKDPIFVTDPELN